MPFKHILLLILVAAIWGFNFVPIKLGLRDVPPLTFSAMRFLLAAFPAIFFVKKPALPLRKLAAFGLCMFAGQFAFLFSAMNAGLSAGLSSLMLQMQAFFTIGFAALFLRERPSLYQILGTVVAAGGIVVVGCHIGSDVTTVGLCLVLLAAMSWASANVLTKSFGKVDMFGVVVWGSLFACPPLMLLAYFIEGPNAISHSIAAMHPVAWAALAYIVYITTFVGFTLWNRMLVRYSASVVAPFALLVPAFAMLSATLILDESYPLWKLAATLLIVTGLCFNQFGARLRKRFFKTKDVMMS
jgi:O-acetylserine/cysteine efflux transporter